MTLEYDMKYDYETTNWEAEARRVARAFDLPEECYFEERLPDAITRARGATLMRQLTWEDGGGYKLPDHEDITFNCTHMKGWYRSYCFIRDLKPRTDGLLAFTIPAETAIYIHMDGTISYQAEILPLLPRFAKGLFHLGLLTPEAERELNVSYTAHERLEWQLEYAGRYEL